MLMTLIWTMTRIDNPVAYLSDSRRAVTRTLAGSWIPVYSDYTHGNVLRGRSQCQDVNVREQAHPWWSHLISVGGDLWSMGHGRTAGHDCRRPHSLNKSDK